MVFFAFLSIDGIALPVTCFLSENRLLRSLINACAQNPLDFSDITMAIPAYKGLGQLKDIKGKVFFSQLIIESLGAQHFIGGKYAF